MSETRRTNVKTEYRDGQKIVTTTTVVITKAKPEDSKHDVNICTAVLDSSDSINPIPAKPKDSFQSEALNQHNYYRKQHRVAPLEWCSKCTAKAQAHADNLARKNSLSHSSGEKYGENLFHSSSSSGPNISASKAVDSWYREISEIKFGEASPTNFAQVGHFTQIVWKDTSHMGMAYAVKGNSVFVVANYLPPGNIITKFQKNVFPPMN